LFNSLLKLQHLRAHRVKNSASATDIAKNRAIRQTQSAPNNVKVVVYAHQVILEIQQEFVSQLISVQRNVQLTRNGHLVQINVATVNTSLE
jgi:hypothetical protein